MTPGPRRGRRDCHWRVMACLLVAIGSGPLVAQPRLVRTEGWRHLFEPGPMDPGIGALAFAHGLVGAGRRGDTLPLFRQPGAATSEGYFVHEADGAGSETYALVWPASLVTNLIEVDYEVPALPVDSLAAAGWVRVIVGFGGDDTPVRAWAHPDPAEVTHISWPDRLADRDLFFRSGVAPAFFDAPDGNAVPFPLPSESDDYVLHPLEARNGWLRVRVVAPSDTCAEPDAPRTAEVWIRYLDRTGRPTVWYHTRGC